jgi:Beta/Gamma crystallin
MRARASIVGIAGVAIVMSVSAPVGFARERRSAGATAQTPPPQTSAGLILFSKEKFTGERREFSREEPDLGHVDFDDTARSLKLAPGQTWQVCAEINFVDCKVVNRDWGDLRGLSMSQTISSVRPWKQVSAGGGGGGYLVLYDERNFKGQSFRVNRETALLRGFRARAESVQVHGGSWELCEQPDFAGKCVVVSENLTDLSSVGMRNKVISVRPAPAAK